MDVKGRVVVVTGGGGGIGRALGRRFAQAGAAHVALLDVDAAAARAAAEAVGERASAEACDVADREALAAVVDRVERDHGDVALFCANAGIATGTGLDSSDEVWASVIHVNLMSVVAAGQVMVPRWKRRGGGYLVVTASAAGLLTTLGDAPYAATKHAAVGLAEWIAIAHGDDGVRVSCLCPQGVRTNMVMRPEAQDTLASRQVLTVGLIEPEAVAEAVHATVQRETFLVLPHPEVADYWRAKATDPDRWLGGMRKFQRRLLEPAPG